VPGLNIPLGTTMPFGLSNTASELLLLSTSEKIMFSIESVCLVRFPFYYWKFIWFSWTV